MKKSIITLALSALTILSTFAGNSNKIKVHDYVVTDKGIVYVTKIKNGFDNTLVAINESGEKTVFNKDEVKAYRKSGQEYKNLYYLDEESYFVKKSFMQRLFTRAGYSLYKNGDSFYVYSNDQYELRLNKENYKIVLSFFFPRFNLLFSE